MVSVAREVAPDLLESNLPSLQRSSSECSWPLVLTASMAPWLMVAGLASEWWVSLLLLGLMAVQLGLGVAVLHGFAELDGPAFPLLAFGAGYVVEAATIAFGVILGVRPAIMFAAVVVAGTAVLLVGASRVRLGRGLTRSVRGGLDWILLSFAICGVYYVPAAFRDAVSLPNGEFQWIYPDTQYHMAVAAAVKEANGRPRMPGMAEAELRYHFAPYAIAGSLAAALPVPLADSFGRVLRGLAQFTLMASALGVGVLLAQRAGLPTWMGIGSPMLLFFYGSLTALFATVESSATRFNHAVVLDIPQLSVQGKGGPFAHILLGHSLVHGTIVLGLGIALAAHVVTALRVPGRHVVVGLFVLCVFFPALNPIAGAGAAGLLSAAVLLRDPRSWLHWLRSLSPVAGVTVGYLVMGYLGTSMNQMHLDPGFAADVPAVALAALLGLGVRVVLFGATAMRYPSGIRWLIAALVTGFLLLYVGFIDEWWHNDRYGLEFLLAGLSLLAGPLAIALLASGWVGPESRRELVRSLLEPSMRLFAIFTGVLLAWLAIRTMSGRAAAPETSHGFKVAGAVALAGLMGTAAALRLLRAAPNAMSRLVAGPVIVAFAIGWLAWLPDWLNFGLDRAHFAVRVPASVASGLAQLRRTTLPGSRIATNQHALASIPNRPERSYFYGALSERPVMLEGWQNGEKLHPSFSAVRRDADSLFSTTDAASFLAIVRRHHVEYIVAAPGTDVGLPEPRPRWLRRLPVDGVVAYAVAAD